MILMKLLRRRRAITLCVLPLLLGQLLAAPGLAGEADRDGGEHGTNVQWRIKDDVITINYDLAGSSDETYVVTAVMKRENDSSFSAIPRTADGDIGEGHFAGKGREITWYYRRDYPQGLQGEGYYFEIQVQTVRRQDNLIYYIAGAAALTGGLVVFLIARDQNHTPPIPGLPTPPGRPGSK